MDRTGVLDLMAWVAGLIQLGLIVLKLCGSVDWYWYQVLAPAWISGLLLLLAAGAFAGMYLASKVE